MAVTNMYSASLEPYQSIKAKNNYNFGVKLAKKSLEKRGFCFSHVLECHTLHFSCKFFNPVIPFPSFAILVLSLRFLGVFFQFLYFTMLIFLWSQM